MILARRFRACFKTRRRLSFEIIDSTNLHSAREGYAAWCEAVAPPRRLRAMRIWAMPLVRAQSPNEGRSPDT